MPVETMFISGPCDGGKTTLSRMVARHVLERPSHFLRLVPAKDGHTNSIEPCPPEVSETLAPFATCHQVTYTADRVFEILPEGLRTVRRIDRRGFAIIEADGDPCLRHAFPYDFRLFVMPSPKSVYDVFRTPHAAAEALQQVMQDTAAFASEIFGLFDAAGLDDTVGVVHVVPALSAHRQEDLEKLDINESQIRQFLHSPVGSEIASRIQLQPAYHGLVESDVVVINTGTGNCRDSLEESVARLEKLLSRLRHDARRHSVLYWGDITSTSDPARKRLLSRLRQLVGIGAA